MKILKPFLFCFALFLGSPSLTLAATYIVDKSGSGDFTTIQDAVNQAAAVESTGPSMGNAYFTHASDIVSIWGGLSSLQIGMLVSVDDRNWYEIAQIIDGQTLRITRPFDENNRFNSYKAVTVSTIEIGPGIYHEKINLNNVHFVRFQGAGRTRESVTIQPPETADTSIGARAFRNVQPYGALYFENLTVRNISVGPIIHTMGEGATVPAPSDTNLTLRNIHFDAQCCDVIYSPYGHVLIENSRLEGENDVLGGFFKSLTIRRTDIMSHRALAIVNAGKAVFVSLLYDSLIEDSLILTKAHDPAAPSVGNGNAIWIGGTNGNTLTIRNSVLITDGGSGAIALNLTGAAASTVFVEGSRLLARSRTSGVLLTTDIQMDATASVTLKCTEYATVAGGGMPVVLPCP